MMHRNTLIIVVLLCLAGCGTPPKERYYTLSMPEPPAAAQGQAAFAVGVGPVSVPDMVDRPQMVLRVAANRMELSELNRWAEPIKRALPRAIAANLAQGLPGVRVYVAGNDMNEPKDYRIRIDVERFESELGKGASVEASWSVRAGDGEVRHGRSAVREAASGPGYDELVAAHSAAAAAIGRDIASTVRTMKR